MNEPSYFEIQADTPERAARFYEAIFGWKFTRDESLPIEYWRMEFHGARGAILKRPMPAPPIPAGTNAFVCSMEISEFDRTAKAILSHGGSVALPKFAVPGRCWQGYFIDTEGNTFGIFQVDEQAK